jgi:hypothetical protein
MAGAAILDSLKAKKEIEELKASTLPVEPVA